MPGRASVSWLARLIFIKPILSALACSIINIARNDPSRRFHLFAPIRTFSWLNVPTFAITHLRHYYDTDAKWAPKHAR